MTDVTDPGFRAPSAQGTLRHDLRTPLNHVIGYAEMLLEDAADQALAERRIPLEETLAAARTALDLINTTLAPTRVVGPAEVSQLYAALAEPRTRIAKSVATLLGMVGPGGGRHLFS